MSYQPKNQNGQATMANSEPVVIASDQSAVPVSGTVTANLSATDNAVLDAIAASVDIIDSIDFATQTTLAAIKAKTDNIPAQGQALAAASTPVVLTAAQITTLTPPAAITGFGTAANQTTIIGHVDGIEGLLTTIDSDTGTIATEVAGLLTDTELRATPVPVSGTVTANLSATDNTVLDNIQTSVDALAGTITAGAVDVNATIDTTGLATDATDTSVASIDSKTPALGQALAASSVPVVLTAAQVTTLTPPAAITGFATSANQTTIIGHVDGIETLIGTTNSTLSTIDGRVDGLETLVGTTNTTLTTIDGRVDGIEGLLTTIDADTGNIATEVAGLLTDTELRATPVPVSGSVTADTELPTAAPLADLSSNPTTTAVGSYLYAFDNGTGYNRLGLLNSGADGQSGGRGLTVGNMIFNGTNYDRERGDATNGTLVNLGANNDVTVTGTVAVTQSGTWDEVGINDSGNSITVDYATTGSGTATGALRVELPTNGTGVIATVGAVTAITNALPAGTNAIGKLSANSGVDIGDVTLTAGTAAVGSILPPDTDVTAHTNYARKYYTNAGAVTDGIIWSPAAGKRWHVVTMYIQTSAAATITLEDDKSGGDDPVWKGDIAANSGVTLSFTEHYPMASGEDAADLIITTSAGNVYVTCVGYEI